MSLISVAHAAGEGAPQGGGFEMIIMLGMFAVIFYFMIYRPQAKRAKEHKNLMAGMQKGDEVLTNGGLVGKISKISEDNDYISIALNDNNEVTIKKDFVTAVLPKGTLKSL
ncbi:SecYEG protein translocase auxillary subunit [Vibrio nigripulchritudo MADA3029]|uniref:Sec translocon accessory complex subunit YajC n=1 Tax=Vibrio nigripulchritudo SOn1 TaxID=1238450 RepID=A0AAV2VMN6_9VIBR|nr:MULTISPECIES: preprotein translocase subunit YajC [Vibrio]EGU55248.1 preprotein translocase subunit YajC [Vibrio nigripulchritudo ATCC 27043]KJY80522.1 preprotein translocase subunit YajC [Vibrio nigripulchritudo]UAB70993.1 preprotein translocase subunit YajC [Vibrio sp. SCSIO 43132]CCN34801.1 SecYEG protein translocase auxillary subunit [Vibrio nigripulchritudo AM115]CCN43122.1 SecYEG protein translocase auxillary subunit [Vibrio nigripulchritudo FTn2]